MKTITIQNQSDSIVNVFSKCFSHVLDPEESLQLSVAEEDTLCLKFHTRNGARTSVDYEPYRPWGGWHGDIHVCEIPYISAIHGKSFCDGDTLTVKEKAMVLRGAWLRWERMEVVELTAESAEKGKTKNTVFFDSHMLKKRCLFGLLSLFLMHLALIGFIVFICFLGNFTEDSDAWFLLLPIILFIMLTVKIPIMFWKVLLTKVLEYTQDARGLCKLR